MIKKYLQSRPRLSVEQTEKVESHKAKTEVSMFAHALVLVGLTALNIWFAADDDVIEDA